MSLRPLLFAAALAATTAHATTVRIHYATTDTITIRADKGPMTWSKGVPATKAADGSWIYTWPDTLGDIGMKPALAGDRVAIGGVYQIKAGATAEEGEIGRAHV